MSVAAAVLAAAVAAPAGAGHGAASYENQLKAAEKDRARKSRPAAAPAAPAAAQSAPPAAHADADRAFAAALRRSLEEDVRLAQRAIDDGSDAKLQELARRVVEVRRREIAELEGWLSEHP
ncbi:MAG TPA: DUF305 domain-containing protein [Candidatus Limnocylindrales bacterium]|nr:DUF305 domain-containing protein [Candidatus Limnocylindrales bacterium]